jgi:hypothetical protein
MVNKIHRLFIYSSIISGVIFCSACETSAKKDKESYSQWAEKDNGSLRKTKIINNVSYSMQFITCEYQAIKNAKLSNVISDSVITNEISICKKSKGQYNFVLVISPTDNSTDLILEKTKSEQEALAVKNYMHFEIAADLKMSTKKGDIPCAMVYYEDMYGLSPNHTFNIVFDSEGDLGKKLKVSFYDRIFGGGLINFSFDMEKIENTTLVI